MEAYRINKQVCFYHPPRNRALEEQRTNGRTERSDPNEPTGFKASTCRFYYVGGRRCCCRRRFCCSCAGSDDGNDAGDEGGLVNHHHHHHYYPHHHVSVMELGHMLTRSVLTYPEVSSKVYHDSFFPLGSSVSLPWVISFEALYLHVVSSFSCIPVICQKLVLFLTPLQFVHFFRNLSKCILLFFSCISSLLLLFWRPLL